MALVRGPRLVSAEGVVSAGVAPDARILRSPRVWLVSILGWGVAGVFLLSQEALWRFALHRPAWAALGVAPRVLANMALWAAFTPFILWLADALPFARGRWALMVPVHFLLGLGWTAVDSAVWLALIRPLIHGPPESFLARFAQQLFACTFSYGLLVAVRQAMTAHRLATRRRLETSELEAELARTQLRALQMQLRPHFLFNALHTVAGLVRAGEGKRAVRTLSELGDLLRWLLDQDGAQLVPLHRELDLLDRYLRIEQIRFQDRLTTQVDVEPRALDALVPSLILQPLVENAVHHGLLSAAHGRIDVTVRIEAPMLCIEVRDSGVGPSGDREGIGLGNTRARLEALYGGAQRFELRSAAEGGAVAQLRIPFQPAGAT